MRCDARQTEIIEANLAIRDARAKQDWRKMRRAMLQIKGLYEGKGTR